ncbi:MAG: flagella synthesis protein FlgN [Rhodospirillaceae bacterium]
MNAALKSSPPGPLLDALEAERELTSRFVELLRREQQALSSGTADELEYLTPRKARIAEELSQHVRTRRAHLLTIGLTPDVPGMRAWAAAHPQASKATAIWESLHALAGQARALNETNGMLLEMRLQHCDRSLAALNEACGRAPLYGRHGHAITEPPSGTSLRA